MGLDEVAIPFAEAVPVPDDAPAIDRLVERLVIFPDPGAAPGGVRVFLGGYADYVRKRDEERRAAVAAPAPPALSTNQGCCVLQWFIT